MIQNLSMSFWQVKKNTERCFIQHLVELLSLHKNRLEINTDPVKIIDKMTADAWYESNFYFSFTSNLRYLKDNLTEPVNILNKQEKPNFLMIYQVLFIKKLI